MLGTKNLRLCSLFVCSCCCLVPFPFVSSRLFPDLFRNPDCHQGRRGCGCVKSHRPLPDVKLRPSLLRVSDLLRCHFLILQGSHFHWTPCFLTWWPCEHLVLEKRMYNRSFDWLIDRSIASVITRLTQISRMTYGGLVCHLDTSNVFPVFWRWHFIMGLTCLSSFNPGCQETVKYIIIIIFI
jgi:hypothetical protein